MGKVNLQVLSLSRRSMCRNLKDTFTFFQVCLQTIVRCLDEYRNRLLWAVLLFITVKLCESILKIVLSCRHGLTSYNVILWGNCNTQSYVHWNCHILIFWQHYGNDSYRDSFCWVIRSGFFLPRNTSIGLKSHEVSCCSCCLALVKIH